jgi:hypothetical protein
MASRRASVTTTAPALSSPRAEPRTPGGLTSPIGRGNATAFSLVELSIVLVILGLLVGGILAGQSLIRASEIRSMATDVTNYAVAIQTFRDKYMALPGDMPNAVAFWGAADGAGAGMTAACATTDSRTLADPRATCNGNGDGRVDYVTQSEETKRAWQHLANAGLISGRYSGTMIGGFRVAGVDIPALRVGKGNGISYDWFGTSHRP